MITRTTSSSGFGSAFDASFRSLTHGLSAYEIPLFRALSQALVGLSGRFDIEEYHGSSRQVTFLGNGVYARTRSRCELSDLMIIVYSPISSVVRLTYLQAKSERSMVSAASKHKYSANLEQWYLLSHRPKIKGIGSFNPPSDLLANALLPSVGTFAFFHKDASGNFQTFYAVANYLTPPHPYTTRFGKLHALGPGLVVNTAGHNECLAASGNRSFAESLYRLEIGTPVDRTIKQALSSRNWLTENLRARIRESEKIDRSSDLSRELIDILGPEDNQQLSGDFGAKMLIIIRSDFELNNGKRQY